MKMAVVDACALTLAVVILIAIPYGRANDNVKAEPKQSLQRNISEEILVGNASTEVLYIARMVVSAATQFLSFGNDSAVATARMKNMMHMMMNPYFLVPQMIMLGFAPIVLANLKMLVMKALMMNNMALSTALFMTIRSLVFGPSPGPQIKYVNYGYRNPHPPRDRREFRL